MCCSTVCVQTLAFLLHVREVSGRGREKKGNEEHRVGAGRSAIPLSTPDAIYLQASPQQKARAKEYFCLLTRQREGLH